jgi:hypothetical protein
LSRFLSGLAAEVRLRLDRFDRRGHYDPADDRLSLLLVGMLSGLVLALALALAAVFELALDLALCLTRLTLALALALTLALRRGRRRARGLSLALTLALALCESPAEPADSGDPNDHGDDIPKRPPL